MTVQVGDVWRDLQAHRNGRYRTVMVTATDIPGGFVRVVSTANRRTRIHETTLKRRFALVSRLGGGLNG